MEVLDAIRGRRSVRRFRKEPIEEEKIECLKEALIRAPSSGNLQMRRFYFVFNAEVKKRLALAAFSQMFIQEAPLVVVACADLRIEERYGKRGTDLYAIQDAAVSMENMLLMAHALSLGSVWVGAFSEPLASEILGLPGHLRPVALAPVGYPAHRPMGPASISTGEAIAEVR
jgi:nitroreductase